MNGCHHHGGVIFPFNSHCPLLKLCSPFKLYCHKVSRHRVARLKVTLEIPWIPKFFYSRAARTWGRPDADCRSRRLFASHNITESQLETSAGTENRKGKTSVVQDKLEGDITAEFPFC